MNREAYYDESGVIERPSALMIVRRHLWMWLVRNPRRALAERRKRDLRLRKEAMEWAVRDGNASKAQNILEWLAGERDWV